MRWAISSSTSFYHYGLPHHRPKWPWTKTCVIVSQNKPFLLEADVFLRYFITWKF
jgi:hypothetical protein